MNEQKILELQETIKVLTSEVNATTMPTTETNSSIIDSNSTTLIKSESTTPNLGNSQVGSLPQISQNALGSKFNQLLSLIDELGKEIRPTYAGNKNSTEKLKRGILHGRTLTRECILEVEKNARQQLQQQQQQQQQQL